MKKKEKIKKNNVQLVRKRETNTWIMVDDEGEEYDEQEEDVPNEQTKLI